MDNLLHVISAEEHAGMSAIDHDEECTINFWAGFLIGVIATLATIASLTFIQDFI